MPGQTISATVTAQGQLSTAEEFGNIILVSNTDGSNVYLKDVAKVSLGMQDYSSSTRLNGVNTTGMAVMLSNSGNALATATAVKEKMAVLQKYFPDGMSWKIPYDTSKFVDISIEKVIHTLLEAIVLVFLVIVSLPAKHPLYVDSDHCCTDFPVGRFCLYCLHGYVD